MSTIIRFEFHATLNLNSPNQHDSCSFNIIQTEIPYQIPVYKKLLFKMQFNELEFSFFFILPWKKKTFYHVYEKKMGEVKWKTFFHFFLLRGWNEWKNSVYVLYISHYILLFFACLKLTMMLFRLSTITDYFFLCVSLLYSSSFFLHHYSNEGRKNLQNKDFHFNYFFSFFLSEWKIRKKW